MTLTRQDIRLIVGEVDCEPYRIIVDHLDPAPCERMYLQVQQDTTNTVDGTPYEAHGRKWLLSPHMTASEVIQTALLACIKFAEHEVREAFKYKDRAIFNTHLDINVLWDNADKTSERT